MQNLPEFDFNKILDQTLYTYTPEKLSLQDGGVITSPNNVTEAPHPWPPSIKYGLVKKLWPMCVLIGILEVIVGVGSLIILVMLASDYDKLYATEGTKVISLMAFGGLITLVVSGMMLLISLMLEKRRVMGMTQRGGEMGFQDLYANEVTGTASTMYCLTFSFAFQFYILTSTFLCVYIFMLSVMKIHFALLILERDTYKVILPENRQFLLSTACVVGIVTMLGSVIHFIGNVTVFTFYNLKYIQPILFNCGP